MGINYRILIIIFLNFFISLSTHAQVFDLKKFIKTETEGRDEPKTQISTSTSGIKLQLPHGWRIIHDEPNSLDAQGPNGMWLAIVMNDYGAGFPVDASLKAYKDSAIQEKGQGRLISWEERIIDGARGIQRVESPMPDPDDPRRITWIGYKGTIGINIVASSKSKDFDNNYQSLNGVLNSIKW